MSKAYFSAPVSGAPGLSPLLEESGQPSGGAPALSGPPRWDLSDLYANPQDPQLTIDLDQADEDSQAFARVWQGRLAGVSGAELAQAIAEYQRIDEVLGRAGSYAQLLFAANTSDSDVARFAQSINERLTAISTHLLFFTLEINRIPDEGWQPDE